MDVNGLQSEILQCSKNQIFLVETDYNHSSFGDMETQSPSELVDQTERELAEIKGLIDEQYGIIVRLKRHGAETKEAIRLLADLFELQQIREQRLAQARIQSSRVRLILTKTDLR